MVNLKRLLEELDEIEKDSEYNKDAEEISIKGLKLIPHGENAVKYYAKAAEYLKKHDELVKRGFINIPTEDLGLDIDSKTISYEFQ